MLDVNVYEEKDSLLHGPDREYRGAQATQIYSPILI